MPFNKDAVNFFTCILQGFCLLKDFNILRNTSDAFVNIFIFQWAVNTV